MGVGVGGEGEGEGASCKGNPCDPPLIEEVEGAPTHSSLLVEGLEVAESPSTTHPS